MFQIRALPKISAPHSPVDMAQTGEGAYFQMYVQCASNVSPPLANILTY